MRVVRIVPRRGYTRSTGRACLPGALRGAERVRRCLKAALHAVVPPRPSPETRDTSYGRSPVPFDTEATAGVRAWRGHGTSGWAPGGRVPTRR